MNPENVIPHQFKKGQRSHEECQRTGRLGGIKSGEKRRERATFKKALEKALNGTPKGKIKAALIQIGYDPRDITNADALMSTLMSMAIRGNTKAMEMILNYQFLLSEDERKNLESAARIAAMKQNKEGIQVQSGDDEDGGVVIYLPALEEEEKAEEEKEGESEGVE